MVVYTPIPESVDSTTLFTYLSTNLPFLFPGILLTVLIVFAIGNYSYNQRRGKGNLVESLAIGSFIAAFGSILLYAIDGLIDLPTITVFVSIMFMFVMMYLSQKE